MGFHPTVVFCFFVCVDLSLASDCVYTYSSHTGNRIVPGKGNFPNVDVITIRHPELKAKQIGWLLGKEGPDGGTYWFASHNDRNLWSFFVTSAKRKKFVGKGRLPTIPFLASFQHFLPNDTSTSSHPVCISNDRLIYIAENGDLVLIDSSGEERKRRKIDAVKDGRLVMDTNRSLVAIYTAPTNDRYTHAVLGDDMEGTVMRILRTDDLSDHSTVHIAENAVFEGVSPMWADIDDDGRDDVVCTVSNAEVGSAIYASHANGSIIGRSLPIGLGFRWRHQLAAADFGADGRVEIADMLMPHSTKSMQFLQLEDDQLRVVARRPGYTSHMYGSRNLDMAVGGDFNGDGIAEMVVVSSSFYRLVALQRSPNSESLSEVWSFWLRSRLTSNLAAISLADGRLALGAGLRDGTIRVFVPKNL